MAELEKRVKKRAKNNPKLKFEFLTKSSFSFQV